MINTDFPNTDRKIPTLTPELTKFIQSMGVYFENQGIPRIGGLILGLLMIAHEPLSSEDIASLLKVSRGSISTNFRLLIAGGIVEKVTFHGERTAYYIFPEAAWEQLTAAAIQQTAAFRRVVEQGLAVLPPIDAVRQRFKQMVEWSDFVIESYQKAITEWRARPDKAGSRSAT